MSDPAAYEDLPSSEQTILANIATELMSSSATQLESYGFAGVGAPLDVLLVGSFSNGSATNISDYDLVVVFQDPPIFPGTPCLDLSITISKSCSTLRYYYIKKYLPQYLLDISWREIAKIQPMDPNAGRVAPILITNTSYATAADAQAAYA